MAKKQFRAESRRLMELMIHSIYTHKEIFLRELISNASDACDKLCYRSLTDDAVKLRRQDFKIELAADKAARTLTVADNGIGMDREDLEHNLGVIAASGSRKFKQELPEEAAGTDVIGQFGVGFYAAFMVSDTVTVRTRKFGGEGGWEWTSSGVEGYTITPFDKPQAGTEVILHLKEDTQDERYSDFLEQRRLQELVKTYSDYIRFPISMEMTRQREKAGSPADDPEYETYTQREVLNSMVPLWQRKRSSVKKEEYDAFYREKFHDFTPPQRYLTVSAEGAVTYKALLFIPAAAPVDFYTRDYQPGLQLYSSGVLIMDRCEALLPEHFRFVRGVVDSPDLSLNISRELLQHDRQLKIIAGNLEKKIRGALLKMLQEDRGEYEAFWSRFGRQLKYGAVSDYGAHKELLQDLLLFWSSTEQKLVTLSEYVSRKKDGQAYIYYAAGETVQRIDRLPQLESLKDAGTEILYFTEEVDEFAAQILMRYQDLPFRSVLDQPPEETQAEKPETDAHGDVLTFVKEALGDAVSDVRPSRRLKSHPVCLTAGEGLSFEMEKYLRAVQPEQAARARRILELNTGHPVFRRLEEAVSSDPERARKYASLLYQQALLIAGLPLEDPSAYTDLVWELMG